MIAAGRFGHFAVIDWSGAAGEHHKGIAVALCAQGNTAPRLIAPHGIGRAGLWSRSAIVEWLRDHLPADTLVGLDLGISLPFVDAQAFFPGWADSPPDARALWAMIDRIASDDPHFGVSGAVDHPDLARYFRRHGGREGDRFGGGRGRLRVTEEAQALMGCNPCSNFNLVGAAQVGKSSLSGMRVLHRLSGHLPVWPVDPLPQQGSVLCEIYTTIAAVAAGRRASRSKIRDGETLDHALQHFGSAPTALAGPIADHAADALLTAAWLRRAATDPTLWAPPALTPKIAQTEGWTFGAR